MKKLLLSFLFVGAVLVSCDKGDDMMTPAQVAADVKVLSIDNPSDFDVFDLDGDNSASGKSSGWSQYKQLVAPNGNKLVYYGTSSEYKEGKKTTVLVLSIADGVLSHYSVRHNDVKHRKLSVAGYTSTIRNLIGDKVYEIAGISTSNRAASRSATETSSVTPEEYAAYLALLEAFVDTDGDRWDDVAAAALTLNGWTINGDNEGSFTKGDQVIGYEPGENPLAPYYLDGDTSSVEGGEYDFATVYGAILAFAGTEIDQEASPFSAKEILALVAGGFSPVSPSSNLYHKAITNDFIIIERWEPRGADSAPVMYGIYEDSGDDETEGNLNENFRTIEEAITAANYFITGVSPEGSRSVRTLYNFKKGERDWINDYSFVRNLEYTVNGTPALQYVLGGVTVSFFYYNEEKVTVEAPGFYREYPTSNLAEATTAAIVRLPAEIRYAREVAADGVIAMNGGFGRLQDTGHSWRYSHARTSSEFQAALPIPNDQYEVYINISKTNSGFTVGAIGDLSVRQFFGTSRLDDAIAYAHSIESLTEAQEIVLNQMFHGNGLVRVANTNGYIVYENVDARLLVPTTNTGMFVEDRRTGEFGTPLYGYSREGGFGRDQTLSGQDGVFTDVLRRLNSILN